MKKTALQVIGMLLPASLLLALFLTPGCASTGNTTTTPSDWAVKGAPILAGATAGAVVYAYSKNTNTEAYVSVIKTALNEFLVSDDMSGAALQAKLYSLNIPELRTPEATLIIAPVVATYKAYADPLVKDQINGNPDAKLLINALINGLDEGLRGINNMRNTPGLRGRDARLELDDNTESLKTIFEGMQKDMKNFRHG